LLLLEGVLRRWVLPSFNEYIYVAKDMLLVFICLRVVLALGYIPIPQVLRHTNVGTMFFAFAVFTFCQGFNPRLPNTTLGLWGVRTYVVPMCLLCLIPLGMPDPRANERYFRLYLLFGIPIAMLCMLQYRLPPGHILNKYANAEIGKNVATVMNVVRVSGPFSYISGLTTYVMFQSAGLLGVLFANRWKFTGNKLIWLSFLLTVAVIPMTGSRSVALYFVLYLLIVAALSQTVLRGSGGTSKMVFAGICVAALSIGLFGEAFDRLAERARTSGDTASRFERILIQPFRFVEVGGLFGFGAAATHQAAPVLVPNGGSYFWLPTRDFEEEAGRVMIELGGFGFLLYTALKISVCAYVFQYIRKYRYAVPLTIPIACLLTVTSCMVTGMIFSSVGSSFYWGMFGLFVAQANATLPQVARRS
jgi:hypothetical protein